MSVEMLNQEPAYYYDILVILIRSAKFPKEKVVSDGQMLTLERNLYVYEARGRLRRDQVTLASLDDFDTIRAPVHRTHRDDYTCVV
jgi:hypothetical protein